MPLLLAASTMPLAAQSGFGDSDFAALAAQAARARESNHIEEAMALYRKALTSSPNWAEGWWALGTLLYDRDAYEEAVEPFQKAFSLSPRSGIAAAMLGLAEAKTGRDADALRHLDGARTLGVGDNPGVWQVVLYTQGTLYLKAGEFGKAQEVLDQLARKGIDREELIVALGQAVLGVLPPALTGARKVVERAGHAEYLAARAEFSDASREYTTLAADFPQFHNVHFALGRFLVATHQDEAAVEAFRAEIQNDPGHLLARLGLAGILTKWDPAAALPHAEEAVRLSPKLGEAHYLVGISLLGTGETKRATIELETARRLTPNEAKIYFSLARAYSLEGREQDAARARAEFARLNAKSGEDKLP